MSKRTRGAGDAVMPPTKQRYVECMKNQFNYWRSQSIQKQVVRTFLREFKPTTAIARGTPIEFDVPGTPHYYNDLSSSNVRIRARIVQPNGVPITDAMHVGTANLYANSMFGDVMVELGGQLLGSATNGLYPYRAYVETLIDTNEENKLTWGQTEGWYKDTPGQVAVADPAPDDANLGLHARERRFAAGREVEMTLRPHVDVFQQELCMPSHVNMRLFLYPARDEFVLKAAAADVAYRLEITEATFVVETCEVTAEMEGAQMALLYKGLNMHFPLKKMEIRQFTITPNQGLHTFEKAFTTTIPDRVLLMLVAQTSKDGHYMQNPFNFAHHAVNHLQLVVGADTLQMRPLTPDYRAVGYYLEAYNSLWRAANKMYKNATVGISYSDFIQGYTIYGVDLSADGSGGECPNAPRKGEVRIEVGFRTNPIIALTLLAIAEKPGWFEIDAHGDVIKPE